MHGCFLDPDRTAPSTADEAARQFTEGQVSTCMRPIGPRCAYGEAAPIPAVRGVPIKLINSTKAGAHHNHRGTCEQYIKGGKDAVKWTRPSCRSFAAYAIRLQLQALAYNLGNFMRTLAMRKTAEPWSLTSLREKLIKMGAKILSHGRYTTFQMPRSRCRDRCSRKSGC